ncbi:EF-P 5-aminopentanol modification-associated protein YfmH [uncultured Limosilactobacillus sp.]|uniref:EF-P 5-aminopentanol modification-associated protein YfmH n=1 Tax=uncultured Limosilactobacillus sp. TaxID=2837629 RepID=UPI0025FE72F7|nr:pitrilysin family protein [uncultured Limosilactobacillus sp.]
MRKKIYDQFSQIVYHERLTNGLDVTLIPRLGFKKTYGILTTDYGSVDNRFIALDRHKMERVPDGIAHFLEHKLFEKADHDAFDLFGELGADSNAFTSYTQTSYQFSTTQNVQKNLATLLDFVQSPYFSATGVAKEQGIIGQEIRMYNDSPDSRLYTGALANLFPKDPMSIDIAGTEQSIAKITPDLLMRCYQTFYQPSNLRLVVVGKLDIEETMSTILKSQHEHQEISQPIQRAPIISDPRGRDVITSSFIRMPVQRAKAMVAIRGLQEFSDHLVRLRYKLACELMLEMLFDDTTANYLRLYQQQVVDDSFGFSFEMERGFHFATISTDTDDPHRFFDEIQSILQSAINNLDQMKEEFMDTKRGALGRLIMSLNSPELIANRYSSSLFGNLNIFDEIELLKSIELPDLYRSCREFIEPQCWTNFAIYPLKM